jgi:Ca-activated chloride channel homolog
MKRMKLLKRMSPVIMVLMLIALLGSMACSSSYAPKQPTTQGLSSDSSMGTTPKPSAPQVTNQPSKNYGPGTYSSTPPLPPLASPGRSQETIGLSAGGAKDVNNFRENINNNYLPIPTDISYEGLFYDYYFDTGAARACTKLFCPSYSFAVTRDPFSHKTEYYLSVGLNSGLKERDFERKKLNLAVVLDTSGSMSSPFDEYFYDASGRKITIDVRERNTQKIEVAKEALNSILDQLNDDDRLSIVVFNDREYLLQDMVTVDDTDMNDVRGKVRSIRANGGTNLSSGMNLATDLIYKYRNSDPSEYENRVIFLTDAQPNLGILGDNSLLSQFKKNADKRIYTTFIGIGVDFNTQLVSDITKVKGANYYSVHSPGEFTERMDNEFEYMVTPLIFNLQLSLDSKGWDIEKVYGSPEADRATGELMKVNTLFPSPKENGETRGGLVLLKLKKQGSDTGSLKLKVTYEDRNGRKDSSESTVYVESTKPEYFDNTGIRKGVLLVRYAELMKDWIIDERQHVNSVLPWNCRINENDGIVMPPTDLGTWERQSMPLKVTSSYRSLFKTFGGYFEDEMDMIEDDELQQELDILTFLGKYRG